ncbi:uncharacterized protein STEHIDRAFT_167618 [Stereum hirsutum FP-91666 SS1]|uniref:uncharacterized protein n=1 Tax=Stereum hirsutum (strain FP-91666) TaxID=721885 RepID=UPI000440CA32|nr:uncharacterized protein STEHIDRAFT_167618 [Stereum hirsutum FP-91666 SS1]EIM88305.1 hypothetical protein STEHIDRAFT_167618 [Stereum hirsutum FP-91666 SS1]
MAFRKTFLKNWWAIEATPIFAIVGMVVAGGGWYLSRLATGPAVVWTKANPTPWNNVEQNEQVKMMSVNQRFDKRWNRDKL